MDSLINNLERSLILKVRVFLFSSSHELFLILISLKLLPISRRRWELITVQLFIKGEPYIKG